MTLNILPHKVFKKFFKYYCMRPRARACVSGEIYNSFTIFKQCPYLNFIHFKNLHTRVFWKKEQLCHRETRRKIFEFKFAAFTPLVLQLNAQTPQFNRLPVHVCARLSSAKDTDERLRSANRRRTFGTRARRPLALACTFPTKESASYTSRAFTFVSHEVHCRWVSQSSIRSAVVSCLAAASACVEKRRKLPASRHRRRRRTTKERRQACACAKRAVKTPIARTTRRCEREQTFLSFRLPFLFTLLEALGSVACVRGCRGYRCAPSSSISSRIVAIRAEHVHERNAHRLASDQRHLIKRPCRQRKATERALVFPARLPARIAAIGEWFIAEFALPNPPLSASRLDSLTMELKRFSSCDNIAAARVLRAIS